MELSRTWRSIQHPHPQKWPQFFKPESGTPSSRKWGSCGWCLAKQGWGGESPPWRGGSPNLEKEEASVTTGQEGSQIHTSLPSKAGKTSCGTQTSQGFLGESCIVH